jgi:hypothetical protein
MDDFCRQTGYDGRSGMNCGRYKITATGYHTGRYQIATDRMVDDGGRFTQLIDHFGGEHDNGKINNVALTNGT